MHMSVLQEANVVLFCQSTSSAGAVGGTDGRRPLRVVHRTRLTQDHEKQSREALSSNVSEKLSPV